jgi:hypothetical protein
MHETELSLIRAEIEAILANGDRFHWSDEVSKRYHDLSRRESALLKQRDLAGV